MLTALGRIMVRWRLWVIAAWTLAVIVAVPFSLSLDRVVNANGYTAPGSQSAKVHDLLLKDFSSASRATALVVFARKQDPLDALDRQAMHQAERLLRRDPAVLRVDAPVFAPHHRLAYLPVTLRTMHVTAGAQQFPELNRRLSALDHPADLSVTLTGAVPIQAAFNQTVSSSLGTAEEVTLPITLVALVAIFGAVPAAVVPILAAFAGITLGLGSLYFLHPFLPLTNYVQDAAAMIGLGVGIDYSLMLISRYRLERNGGSPVHKAVTTAVGTAGQGALVSGLVVIATNLVLAATGQPLLVSIGVGVMAAVFFTVLATLTLTPALIATAGPFFEWPGALGRWKGRFAWGRGMWAAVARWVMGRPWWITLSATLVLLVLAAPAVGMHLWGVGVSTLPTSNPARQGYFRYTAAFGRGSLGPLLVVVQAPANVASPTVFPELRRLEKRLRSLPGVHKVTGLPDLPSPAIEALRLLPRRPRSLRSLVSTNRHLTLLTVTPTTAPNSQASLALVPRIRQALAGFRGHGLTALVGGETAQNVDVIRMVTSSFPMLALAIVGISYVFLLFLFRSLFLPLKAVLMTLLSTLASFGFLVLVFQDGIGSSLLGFHSPGAVAWDTPPMIFAVLFGLSTDYEVFLISRIQERYRQSGNNRESVALGLEETAGLITSAALLMISVFVAFGLGELEFMKELGLGMSFAILLDATLVRVLLVPATMALLGRWNWWLPGLRKEVSRCVPPTDGPSAGLPDPLP